jgi:hypothetical protein
MFEKAELIIAAFQVTQTAVGPVLYFAYMMRCRHMRASSFLHMCANTRDNMNMHSNASVEH